MKILVITPTFLPLIGGAEIGIYEIYQRLGRRHDVRILTPEHPEQVLSRYGEMDPFFDQKNFEVRHFEDKINLYRFRLPQLLRNRVDLFSISYVKSAFAEIRNFQPDVINFHYAIPGGLAIGLIRTFTSIPVVLSLIGRTDVLTSDTPLFKKLYISQTMELASRVAPISDYYLREAKTNAHTQVIPYGVDTDRFSPQINGDALKKRLGIENGQMVLFALQRLSAVKRADVLVRSMPLILEKYPEAVLVIGGKGPTESSLKDLVNKLKINNMVLFTGYIREESLPEYFAMADVFAFHSTNETFGIVLVQALAAGIPVVSVNCTSIPDVIDHDVNGILVDPLDPTQMAAAVVKLLDNRDLMDTFSKNGREKALNRYSWDVVAGQYESLFEELS